MKKKIVISSIIISVFAIATAFQSSVYSRRVRPVTSFGACAENEIAYNMVAHTFGVCTNTGYKTLLTSSSGAPIDAKYITQTANSSLTNEQALSALTTGILKNTTTTGVLSIATEADYLPSQISNSGKYLTTNGTATSWGTISSGITCVGCTTDTLIKFNGTNGTNSQITDDGTDIIAIAAGNSTFGSPEANGLQVTYDSHAPSLLLKVAGDFPSSISMDGGAGTITNTAATSISNQTPLWGTGTTGVEFQIGGTDGNRISKYNNSSPTDGLLLIGRTDTGSFRTGTLTSGAGIYIVNGPGSITISLINSFFNSGTPSVGGNGTIVTNSTDSAGKVTSTTTGVATITVTFAGTFINGTSCTANNNTTANIVRSSSTTTILTIVGTTVTGDVISYQCLGY